MSFSTLFGHTLVHGYADREYIPYREDVLRFLKEKPRKKEANKFSDIYEAVFDILDNHASLGDEWTYWVEVQEFLKLYKELSDTRSRDDRLRSILEERAMFSGNFEAEMSGFYPQEYGKLIPGTGCWIMVLMVVPVAENVRPQLYGVYYALPEWVKSDIRLETMVLKTKRLKARITTEGGEVMLHPHEYCIVHNIDDVLSGIGTEYEIIKLGGQAAYDEEKVYYLLTRGVPIEETYRLLLGGVGSINFQYFRLLPEAFEMYDFLIPAMQKGISYDMACRLWYHKQTGTPIFKFVNRKLDGKDRSEGGEDRPKDDPAPDQTQPETGKCDSPPRSKRKR